MKLFDYLFLFNVNLYLEYVACSSFEPEINSYHEYP